MPRLILASASAARASMLRNAGVHLEIKPADVDEDAVKCDLLGKQKPLAQIAEALAQTKAQLVSEMTGDAIVIGADQILIHNDTLFDKPRSIGDARMHLEKLRGDTHRLVSAVSVAQHGTQVWSAVRNADLTMRDFSDDFLMSYLANFGDKALTSVGAYHLEGLGAQLFNKVEGDYFTVLGLPLLDLLEFLRIRGVLKT
jgi:septum formation protein